MDHASVVRQQINAAEYVQACKDAGIEPELPRYKIGGARIDPTDSKLEGFCEAHLSTLESPAPAERHFPPELMAEIAQEDDAGERAEILRRLIQAVIGGPLTPNTVRAASIRLIILCFVLQAAPCDEPTLVSIARKLGVSRALLSHYLIEIHDTMGLTSRAAKPYSARKAYSLARNRAIKAGMRNTRSGAAKWKTNESQKSKSAI
jgi:hypothetical protein